MDGLSVALLVIISLLVFASGLISSTYDLRDKTKPHFFRSLTSAGIVVIIITLGTIALTVAQFVYSDYKDDKDDAKRDSIIRSDYARSVQQMRRDYVLSTDSLKKQYDTSTKDIVRALAEYGLKYDTAQKRVEKLLKDSARNNIYAGPEPELTMCPTTPLLLDSASQYYDITINLCAIKAGSKLQKSMAYMVIQNEGLGYDYVGEFDVFNNGMFLASDIEHSFPNIQVQKKGVTVIYIIVDCKFTDNSGKRTYTYTDVANCDLVKKTIGFATKYRQEKVKEALERKGIRLNL